MRRFPLLLLLVAVPGTMPLLAQSPNHPARDLNDHGIFEIYSHGKSIGTDTFQIRVHSDRVEAEGKDHLEVEQNGKTIEVETSSDLVLDSELNPISYTWSQKGPQSSHLSVDFSSEPAHVRYKLVDGKEDKRDYKLDRDVLILDDNEIHDYELAIARFDQGKGGVMVLSGFTPQEALPGVIILNFVGPQQVNLYGQQVTLRHFTLAAASTQIHLWADDRGRLQMVSAADMQFQAVRKKEDAE